jgi:catechol 1,2-dioxygenase
MTDGDQAARLVSAMPRVVTALHGLARELDLTTDELLAVLGFLGEVARADELILLSDVLGLSRLVDDQTHAGSAGTPSNVLGPFYRPGAPWISNPGSIATHGEPGERITVWGRVTDAGDGRAVTDATLDVWQANADGVYSNEDSRLHSWSLRGRQRVDADGAYAFDTVRPLHYTVKDDGPVGQLLAALGRHPWRPAHIHFLVSAQGRQALVTQAYLAGGAYLSDDAIDGVKEALITPVQDGRLCFDIELPPAGDSG